MFGKLLFAVIATLVLQVDAQCATTSAIASPTKPAADPFWSPPSDISSRAQGSVFNCRAVNWNSVNGAMSYYQYAYKTIKATDNSSMVAVATLIIPNGTTPGTKFSQLLSYQVPYDSPTSFCGPSFVNQPGSGGSTTNTYGVSNGADQAPTQALNAGIPVVISDYEGSIASFTVAQTEGYGTLNGIRAVISASGFFTSQPNVALWGYSGGALSTEFALELAATQAQDLKIIGAALGGLTPITRNVAMQVNGFKNNPSNPSQSVYNALVPYSVLGISAENRTVQNWIQTNLKTTSEPGAPNQASFKDRFNHAASDNCNVETALDFTNANFNNWFNNLPASGSLFDVPIVSDAFNLYGIMGQTGSNSRTTPQPPLYFYKGTADEVSNITDTDALVAKYCGAGARITYVKLSGQNHSGAQTSGLKAAWAYLQARFQGTPVSAGCPPATTQ